MNRRSMLIAAIGACATLLFPRRKVKAESSSWSYFATWAPGKVGCSGDLVSDCSERVQRALAAESKKHNLGVMREQGGSTEIAAYESFVYHARWDQKTVVLWTSKCGDLLVSIDDQVVESISDSELGSQLTQAFLWSCYKNKVIHVAGRNKFVEEGDC